MTGTHRKSGVIGDVVVYTTVFVLMFAMIGAAPTAAQPQANASIPLYCGAAKENINPDLPASLAGYQYPKPAEKIHDDIHVAVLYLRRENVQLALLTYDLVALRGGFRGSGSDFIAEVQQRCSDATGIPVDNIVTSASHTHSAPGLGDDSYRTRVLEASVTALRKAVETAVPARAGYYTTRIRENVNRRVYFPDGTVRFLPSDKFLMPIADEYVDDQLGLMYFSRADVQSPYQGEIAAIVNYAAHPVTTGATANMLSADYPGVIKREIEKSTGAVALFTLGAAGDLHPVGMEGGYGECERMGMALAEKAVFHHFVPVMLKDVHIRAEHHEITLPAPSREEFENMPHVSTRTREYSERMETMYKEGGVKTKFSLMAIGPILFIGVPGELSAESGRIMKWESPFPQTFIMNLASGAVGYMSHRNAYAWGGYEASSRMAPRSVMMMCREIVDAAEAMRRKMEQDGASITLPRTGDITD